MFKKTLVNTGHLVANSTVVPDITCGVGTFLAAGATLTKSSKDWSMMVGTPARQVGWVSAFGEKIDLPMSGQRRVALQAYGDIYELNGSELIGTPVRRTSSNMFTANDWSEWKSVEFRRFEQDPF